MDCTQWNAERVSKLLDADVVNIFPNIRDDSAEQSSCREVVKEFLEAAFPSEGSYSEDSDMESPSQRCYTNCTATLSSSDRCELSVFLLEKVDARRVSDLNPDSINIPSDCGIYNITCCTESLPAECLRDSDQSTGSSILVPLVGGVVGGVVGLTGLIATTLAIGVVVMVCSRHKKREHKQR